MKNQVTIESVSVDLLKRGKSAQEVLELIKKIFPNSKTSIKCIYYYSSKYKIGLSRKIEINQAELKKALAS